MRDHWLSISHSIYIFPSHRHDFLMQTIFFFFLLEFVVCSNTNSVYNYWKWGRVLHKYRHVTSTCGTNRYDHKFGQKSARTIVCAHKSTIRVIKQYSCRRSLRMLALQGQRVVHYRAFDRNRSKFINVNGSFSCRQKCICVAQALATVARSQY